MNPTLKALEALQEKISGKVRVGYSQDTDHASEGLKQGYNVILEVKKKIRIHDGGDNILDEPWDYGEM